MEIFSGLNRKAFPKILYPIFAALLGVGCSCWAFYPGFMNGDASWQLSFARQFKFINWHPPIMSLIWRPLDYLLPGTGSLFLLQISLYWISIAIFCTVLFRNSIRQLLLILLVGFSPALFIGTALILKDSMSVGFLMLSAALIKTQESRKGRVLRLLTLGALFTASALRYNSFIAVLPLLYWNAVVTTAHRTKLILLGKTLLQGVLILSSIFLLNSWLLSESNRLPPYTFFGSKPEQTSKKSNFPAQMILTYDLVGISTFSDVNYLPQYFARDGRPPLSLEEVKAIYSPDTALMIFFYPSADKRSPGFTLNESEFNQLKNAWLLAVLSQPTAYLKHRFGVFRSHLGINPVWPYWYPGKEDIIKEKLPNPGVKQIIGDWITSHRDRFYFRNFFYYLSIFAIGIIGFARGTLGTGSKTLIASSLLLLASHFFLLPGGDFRYSWWPVAVLHILLLTSISTKVTRSPDLSFSLPDKKLLDFYLGMILLLLLRPFVRFTGRVLGRDHSLEPKGRIVVQKFLGGGSLLLAYPALLGIRNKYPSSKLILVTTKNVGPFGEILGIFDEIILIDDRSLFTLVPSALNALRKLLFSDTVLDLEVYSRLSTVFALLTLSRNRISLVCDEVFLRKNVSTHLIYFNRFTGQYIFYDQMAFLLGAEVASPEDCSERIKFRLNTDLKPSNTLVIGHGCSDHLQERCLGPAHWLTVFKGTKRVAEFESIIFLGSLKDHALGSEIITQLKTEFPKLSIINRCGECDLKESIEILAQAKEFWGIDSALLHFARVLKIKTLSFWGPTEPRTRLREIKGLDEEIIYEQIHCSPCVHTTELPPCGGNNLCIKRLFEPVTKEELLRNTIQ